MVGWKLFLEIIFYAKWIDDGIKFFFIPFKGVWSWNELMTYLFGKQKEELVEDTWKYLQEKKKF